MTTQPQGELLEHFFHYQRECADCGNVWFSLHCPHDGIQTPCINCGNYPKNRQSSSVCDCKFVMPVDTAEAHTTAAVREFAEKVKEWEQHHTLSRGLGAEIDSLLTETLGGTK